MDAKEELLSSTFLGSHHKDPLHISLTMENMQAMEIDRNISKRKRKTTNMMVTVPILS